MTQTERQTQREKWERERERDRERRERERERLFVCWLVGCLTSHQHASVYQGRICTDNFTRCHTEIEAADQNFLPQPVTAY